METRTLCGLVTDRGTVLNQCLSLTQAQVPSKLFIKITTNPKILKTYTNRQTFIGNESIDNKFCVEELQSCLEANIFQTEYYIPKKGH